MPLEGVDKELEVSGESSTTEIVPFFSPDNEEALLLNVPLPQAVPCSRAEEIYTISKPMQVYNKKPEVSTPLPTATNHEFSAEVPTNQSQPPMTEVFEHQQ